LAGYENAADVGGDGGGGDWETQKETQSGSERFARSFRADNPPANNNSNDGESSR
jgi:hypothetical protein